MVVAAPSITFAIPFYSGRELLARSIRSLVAQRDDSWRGFVCDNASPEPGIEELVAVEGQGRVGYVRNETNLGMTGNFNRCIALAETDLVTLLHSDDELLPDYCATMRAAAARHADAVAIFCRYEVIGADSEHVFSVPDLVKEHLVHPSPKREYVLAGEAGLRALAKANFISAPTLCFRKALLGDDVWNDQYKFVLDWELTTSLLLDGKVLVSLPDRCYRYRRHEAATTDQMTREQSRYREEAEFYEHLRAVATERGWTEAAAIAKKKRMLKLQLAYRALQNVGRLELGAAKRELELLRELS